MQIVSDTGKQDEIKADLAYDQPYRFRLWLAAVEDSTTLGMGFRAYFSHIRSCLAVWEKSGVSFVNAKNQKLNLDILKADDLWGFLGKKDLQPQGPKRSIDPMKIAVLDVYMKKKYPVLAATFAKSSFSPEVAAVLRSFFNRGLALDSDVDFVGPWSGIYVSSGGLDAEMITQMRRKGEVPKFNMKVIMLRPSERPDFCVAHKLIIPLTAEYFNEKLKNTPEWQNINQIINHHSAKDTLIYSGIALIAHRSGANSDIRASLMLRDRTTYAPSLSQLTIKRRDEGFDETRRVTSFAHESIDENWVNSYFYCDLDSKKLSSERFSEKLFEELYRLYDALGEET